ncbi:MAG: T9SS type A sorting domain-containing protein [Crocinitomicaceae bacterium]
MKNCVLFVLVLLIHSSALYAQDGVLDNSFDSDGIVTMDISNSNDVMKSIITQPDGKIIVAGYTSDMVIDNFCVARFHSNGTIDNSFGVNGIVVTAFPSTSLASEVALQNDGKIIAVGHTWEGSVNNFALARYNSDGSLDASFGNSGIISTSLFGNNAFAKTLKVQNDGKIIVGGMVFDSPPDGSSLAIVRYNQDGTLDNTFGGGGISTTDVTPGFGLTALDILNDLAIQQNGKVVVCGISGPDGVILRYNSDGNLDLSFGLNGIKTHNFSTGGMSVFNGIDLQQDGKIITVGFSSGMNGISDLLVIRSNINGDLDNTFGNMGIIFTPLSAEADGAEDVLVQQDGKILVGGNVSNSIYKFALTRYDTDGNPDLTFGTNGLVQTEVNSESSYLNAITIQTDGKILATGTTGSTNSDITIIRYSSSILSSSNPIPLFENASIYPNPTSDNVSITFMSKQEGVISIKLFDMSGRLLLEKNYPSLIPGIKNTKTLQLEVYSEGIYFIGISTSNTSRIFKVVKK